MSLIIAFIQGTLILLRAQLFIIINYINVSKHQSDFLMSLFFRTLRQLYLVRIRFFYNYFYEEALRFHGLTKFNVLVFQPMKISWRSILEEKKCLEEKKSTEKL